MGQNKILFVDDETDIVLTIKKYFEDDFPIQFFTSPLDALKKIKTETFDIIIVDYRMPELNGLELLIEAKKSSHYTYGILFTAYADKEILESAINQNLISAVIEKPLDFDILRVAIHKAIEECNAVKVNEESNHFLRSRYEKLKAQLKLQSGTIIGIEKGLKEVYQKAMKFADFPINILLTGETGTGKELFARAIHEHSGRRKHEFIAVNCAAIPEALIESELFGHEKGAFTGAIRDKTGKFELADKGTLFLDEIGELKKNLQVKLLRVLQDKVIEKVGGSESKKIDFRLITATNRDLKKLIRLQQFREDLFFRINEVDIHLPALKDRPEDIEDLLSYFMLKYSNELSIRTPQLANNVVACLKRYPWKGNVREFENAVKRVLILNRGKEVITQADFNFLFHHDRPALTTGDAFDFIAEKIIEKKLDLKLAKQKILLAILGKFKNDITEAVKHTGIKRDQFYTARKYAEKKA